MLQGRLHAGIGDPVAPFQAALCDEAFGLPGISLVLDASVDPADDTVEGSAFLGVVSARADTRCDRDLVLLRDFGFEPV